MTEPEKALALKLMHAHHHNSFDSFTADDAKCFTRTFLPILLFIKGGNRAIDALDIRHKNTLCRTAMRNLTAQLSHAVLEHNNRVGQNFALPAGYNNVSEEQRNHHYQKQCENYMTMCSTALVTIDRSTIALLVGLMKGTRLLDDMDLRWYYDTPCHCTVMSDWQNTISKNKILAPQKRAEANAITGEDKGRR